MCVHVCMRTFYDCTLQSEVQQLIINNALQTQCLQVYGFVCIFTELDVAIRVYGMYHGITEIKQVLSYTMKDGA